MDKPELLGLDDMHATMLRLRLSNRLDRARVGRLLSRHAGVYELSRKSGEGEQNVSFGDIYTAHMQVLPKWGRRQKSLGSNSPKDARISERWSGGNETTGGAADPRGQDPVGNTVVVGERPAGENGEIEFDRAVGDHSSARPQTSDVEVTEGTREGGFVATGGNIADIRVYDGDVFDCESGAVGGEDSRGGCVELRDTRDAQAENRMLGTEGCSPHQRAVGKHRDLSGAEVGGEKATSLGTEGEGEGQCIVTSGECGVAVETEVLVPSCDLGAPLGTMKRLASMDLSTGGADEVLVSPDSKRRKLNNFPVWPDDLNGSLTCEKGVVMREDAYHTLLEYPRAQLSDECLSFYLRVIRDANIGEFSGEVAVGIVTESFLLTGFLDSDQNSDLNTAASSLSRWRRRFPLVAEVEWIIMPLYLREVGSGHWQVIILRNVGAVIVKLCAALGSGAYTPDKAIEDVVGEIEGPLVISIDSLSGRPRASFWDKLCHLVKVFFTMEWHKRQPNQVVRHRTTRRKKGGVNLVEHAANRIADLFKQHIVIVAGPKQVDSLTCGWHVATHFALCRRRGYLESIFTNARSQFKFPDPNYDLTGRDDQLRFRFVQCRDLFAREDMDGVVERLRAYAADAIRRYIVDTSAK